MIIDSDFQCSSYSIQPDTSFSANSGTVACVISRTPVIRTSVNPVLGEAPHVRKLAIQKNGNSWGILWVIYCISMFHQGICGTAYLLFPDKKGWRGTMQKYGTNGTMSAFSVIDKENTKGGKDSARWSFPERMLIQQGVSSFSLHH